jgi:hypothetical protein
MRQLSVTAALGHMVRSTFQNWQFALRAQWPWILVLGIAYWAVGSLIGWDVFSSGDRTNLEERFVSDPSYIATYFFSLIALAVVYMLAMSSIAVSWHRYILRDEMPQSLADKLRLDSVVWRYLKNVLGISILLGLCLVPFFIMGIAFGGSPESGAAPGPGFMAMFLLGTAVSCYLLFRMGLKFPAIAIERRDFGFKDGWRITSAYAWPMFLLTAAFVVITFVIGRGADAVGQSLMSVISGGPGTVLNILITSVVQWITTIFGITLYTSLYGFFVEDRNF